MPIDPAQMAAVQGGADPGLPAGGGAPPGGISSPGAGPMGSPMSGPEQQSGHRAEAMAQVHTAMQLLSMALSGLGVMSPEGEAVMSVLKTLTKKLGSGAQQGASLGPAQIDMMKNSAVGGPDVATLLAMQGGGGGMGGPMQ